MVKIPILKYQILNIMNNTMGTVYYNLYSCKDIIFFILIGHYVLAKTNNKMFMDDDKTKKIQHILVTVMELVYLAICIELFCKFKCRYPCNVIIVKTKTMTS